MSTIRVLSGEEEARLAAEGVLAGIPKANGLVADLGGEAPHLVVRALQELVQQAQLAHHFQRGRMHGVTPEIPQEIGVLLKHDHIDAGARQQIAQHHARRAAAGDAAAGGELAHR